MAKFISKPQSDKIIEDAMEQEQRCLNAAEAATYLGVSKSTFKNMVKNGDAPKPIQITRGRLVWDKKKLDSFIEALAEF